MLVLVALGIFFGLDTAKQPERFVSIAGLVVNILFCWLFSRHPRKVSVNLSYTVLALFFLALLFCSS